MARAPTLATLACLALAFGCSSPRAIRGTDDGPAQDHATGGDPGHEDPGVPRDPGPRDPGQRDLGAADLGPPDPGQLDPGSVDVEAPDADPTDPGPTDLGPADAGPPDPGPPDPGLPDPGPPDPGPPDPGPPDPGPPDPGPPDPGPPDPGPAQDVVVVIGRYTGTFEPLSQGDTLMITHGFQGGIHVEIDIHFWINGDLPDLKVDLHAENRIDGKVVGSFEFKGFSVAYEPPDAFWTGVLPLIFETKDAALYDGKTATLQATITLPDGRSGSGSVSVVLMDP